MGRPPPNTRATLPFPSAPVSKRAATLVPSRQRYCACWASAASLARIAARAVAARAVAVRISGFMPVLPAMVDARGGGSERPARGDAVHRRIQDRDAPAIDVGKAGNVAAAGIAGLQPLLL